MKPEINLEKFYGKLRVVTNSVVVTIPANVIKYGGYAEGDEIVIYMKKKKND